jgi:Tfp pilus assembly protein PilF
MLDADGTYTAADIPKMLEYFPDFDQVNGARTSEQGDLPLLRAPVKWLVRMFVSLLVNKKIPDLQTGLKAFKRDMMLPYLWVIPDKFSHCPLITLAFLCNGHTVKYIPTEYHKRIGGRSKYHPIKDTAYVLMQVCRFMMYFNPVVKNLVKLLAVITICCVGIIVYSNTFFTSFHFDDQVYIVTNYFIKNIHNLLHYWEFYPCRFITFLSIVVNYHFNGLNVFGYHLFNLAVHLGTAILVWWLTLLTLSTPAMKENKITAHADLIALFAGLVFVSHPVQIEAVTYIWQRASSMAALFYLASLCLYVKSRLLQAKNPGSGLGRFYYIFSLVTAIVAMFTKESSVTLPLMILLYEFSFFEAKKSLNWKHLSPFLLTIFIVPLTILITKAGQFQAIQRFVLEPGGTSPLNYLLTQFRVVVTYIRLIFLPFDLNMDYDYSISKSIFEWPTLISFLFLAGVLFSAKRLFLKYRLVSFSIFWFFLTLSLESSLLPLKNVIFEHRLYLPLVGYSMFLVSGVYYLSQKSAIKTMVIVLTMIITFNSILTYQRNKVWKNEFTLWDDAVRKSPHKEKAYYNRGFSYAQQGNFIQAISDYNKAIEIDPDDADAYYNRGLSFVKQRHFTEAVVDFNKTIEINPNYADAYNNRGIIYAYQGNSSQAISNFTRAIEINPNDAEAYCNRGNAYYLQGNLVQAILDYSKAIEIDPKDAEAYNNRVIVYNQLKRF